MREKINELLNLQYRLNNMTNGNDWRNGITNKGKNINWFTAIMMESAEAIDSTPWKHWKAIDGKADIENIKIEVVDLYHFLMSALITYKGMETASDILSLHFVIKNKEQDFDMDNFNLSTKLFMYFTLQMDIFNEYENMDSLVDAFKSMMVFSGLTFEKMYELYIMKNALNMIRQNNGYKEGTYKKIWNGVEDNVYLHRLLDENKDLSFDEIMESLQSTYDSILFILI